MKQKRTIYGFYSNDPLSNDQGGGAEHFRCIYRLLNSKNEDFKLISSKLGDENFNSEKVEYISISPHFGKYYLNLFIWFFKNRNKIKKDDIFHFHRNYCVWPKYLFCKKKGKVIISYHNTTGQVIKGMIGVYSKLIRNFMIFFEKKSLSYANLIIFVADRVREEMKPIIGTNFNKTVVIPAAFNNEKFKNSVLPVSDVFNKILTIGRISHQKNFELALRAFEKSKKQNVNLTLTIAGDGELKQQLIKIINQSVYKKDIDFLGLVPHDEVPKLIQSHGIVLVSSRYEASPTIVKESIASLRPVVTTDVGDVNLWVIEGKNGFISKHNSNDLSDKILKANSLLIVNKYEQAVDLNIFSENHIMNQLYDKYLSL